MLLANSPNSDSLLQLKTITKKFSINSNTNSTLKINFRKLLLRTVQENVCLLAFPKILTGIRENQYK